jgi:4-amino-4-deoxy-L-arabinose transferase-like glycosyltransferase
MKKTQNHYYLIANIILGFIVFTFGLIYALIMPPFSGPDELFHYNSVVRVIDGGGWPLPYKARILENTQTAVIESGYKSGSIIPNENIIIEPSLRSSFLKKPNETTGKVDNMVQHPPLYYYFSAFILKIFSPFTDRWDQAIFIMRLVSSLLVASSIFFISQTISNVGLSPKLALISSTSVLAIPMLLMQSGYVNNDNLLIFATSACFYFLIKKWPNKLSLFHPSVFAGLFLGIALLTKGFALLLIPFVLILSIIASQKQSKKNWLLILIPQFVGLIVGGWWWIRNLIFLGKIQPSIYGIAEHNGVMSENYDFLIFISTFFSRLNRTFWTRAGRSEIAIPDLISDIAGIMILTAIIITLVFNKKRLILSVVLAYILLITAVLFVRSNHVFYYFGVPNRGIQGRYLFSGLIFLPLTIALLTDFIKPVFRKYFNILPLLFILISWASLLWNFYKIYTFNKLNNLLTQASYFSGIQEYIYTATILTNIILIILFFRYLKEVNNDS